MKTRLWILAAMAIPASAHASTSVVLYGLVDGGLQYQKVKIDGYGTARTYGPASDIRAGSRWGLKGREDLGNGISALFVLENGFSLSNGATGDKSRGAFNRQAYMGIASDDFGTLTLGRQYSSFNYFGTFGSFATGFGLAGSSRTFSTAFVRYDNLIKYETPTWHGLKTTIGYSNQAGLGTGAQNPEPGQNKDDAINAFMAGVLYENGPFRFTANFDRIGKVPDAARTTTGSIKVWNTAVSYDAKLLKITAAFGQDVDGRIGILPLANFSTLGVGNPAPNVTYMRSFKTNNYSLGATVPFGQGNLLLNWMMSDSNLENIKTAGNNGVGVQNAFSIGYTYEFSKRTNLYAVGTYMKNMAYISNSSAQEYSIGLQHKF